MLEVVQAPPPPARAPGRPGPPTVAVPSRGRTRSTREVASDVIFALGRSLLSVPPAPGPVAAARALRSARLVGLTGLLLMVALAGKLAAPIGQVPPTRWFGLLGAFDNRLARGAAGVGLITGLVLLAWAFLLLLRLAVAGQVTVRQVTRTVLLWAAPLLVGPPLMSLDVHSYVAQGEMARIGLDPYRVGPEFMRGDFYDPVDPRWRAAHAPYGPLALLLSKAAVIVSGHSPVGSVLLLRIVAAGAVAVAAVLALRLASDRATTLVLTAGCPLVLVTLVSAAHHEAVVTALIMAALVAQRAGRPTFAVGLAALALADKLPGAVALGALGMLHLAEATGLRDRLRVLARDGAAVLVVWVPLALAVPNPLGWVRALSTPGLGRTAYAPVSLVAFVTRVPESLVRAAGEVLSVLIVGRLILTVRRRPLAATVGWGLLAVGLLGPVLYPWYLTPAAVVLATLEGRGARWVSAASGSWGLIVALPLAERVVRWLARPSVLPGPGVAVTTHRPGQLIL